MPWRCAASSAVAISIAYLIAWSRWQRALRQPIGERLAFEARHDEEVGAVVLADIVERADVRVIEGRDRFGFALESLAAIRVGRGFVGQNLDRDGAIEPAVFRAIHLAHAARAERRDDFIGAEAGAGGKAHRIARFYTEVVEAASLRPPGAEAPM